MCTARSLMPPKGRKRKISHEDTPEPTSVDIFHNNVGGSRITVAACRDSSCCQPLTADSGFYRVRHECRICRSPHVFTTCRGCQYFACALSGGDKRCMWPCQDCVGEYYVCAVCHVFGHDHNMSPPDPSSSDDGGPGSSMVTHRQSS